MNRETDVQSLPGAIVTGSSRGIGAAIARRLGALGHGVCVNYVSNEDRARAVAEEIEAAGGRAIPELISLEAVCWFRLGVTDRSRRLLLDVIRQRPNDPLNYQNLGVLCLKEGDRAGALSNWVKALRLDPKNRDLEDRIRELLR